MWKIQRINNLTHEVTLLNDISKETVDLIVPPEHTVSIGAKVEYLKSTMAAKEAEVDTELSKIKAIISNPKYLQIVIAIETLLLLIRLIK